MKRRVFMARLFHFGWPMSFAEIKSQVETALAKAGRRDDSVVLMAVSKQQPLGRVTAVLDAGHRVFGENRVQEAQTRWPPFIETYGPIDLHLIGPLQTNKARQAVEIFGTIHSVDRMKLAHKLADLAQDRGHSPDLFVQINTGEEPQKAGIAPHQADSAIAEMRALDLPIKGVMCIPPAQEEPSLHFALLAKIAARNGLTGLSMGMSADFTKAIEFGATHIRVGSAIFGARAPRSIANPE
jgi:pyridoxal phosphate enzyme (YggS family)